MSAEKESGSAEEGRSGTPQPPVSECRTLWIGDVQPMWDEGYVGTIFSSAGGLEAGDIVEVKLIRDKHTGFPAGYGFIEFQSREVAEKVLETCNGQPIPGTSFRFRLNWGAGGKRLETAPEYSIFVGDLAPEVTELMLQELFMEKYPSALGAKVVMDPVSGMSKGFGFVRFGKEGEKDEALTTMTGVQCGSRPIRVAPATAKKSSTAAGASATPGLDSEDPNNTTVFVGGIDASVTEELLRDNFSQFGEIVYVKIPPGRGCGFVQYVQRSSAENAIARMQGRDVKGCKVRLSWGRSSPARREALTGIPGMYAAGPGYGAGPAGYPPPYQLYSPQMAYAPPGSYGATPYSYSTPYGPMAYSYGAASGAYPTQCYVQPYSPSVEMGPMPPEGAMPNERAAPAATPLPAYGNISYFDRSTADVLHRPGGRGGVHKMGGIGPGGMKGLTSRLEGLDITQESAASYAGGMGAGGGIPGPKGAGMGRGPPRKPGAYRMPGGPAYGPPPGPYAASGAPHERAGPAMYPPVSGSYPPTMGYGPR